MLRFHTKRIPMKKFCVLAAVAMIIVAGVEGASAQTVATVYRTEKIPQHFKTYSLFLMCNPKWLTPKKGNDSDTTDLFDLYTQFKAFGRTIGDDNVAVWFWKSTSSSHEDSMLAGNVDVERSVRFCKAWKLKPSAGPHVVVTSTYPDESNLSSGIPENSAVFALGNMNSKKISDLLARLTDQLIASGKVDKPATDSPAQPPPGLWVRLLAATQQAINNFGCAWSFKIDAGPVSADLHSCSSHS